MRVRMSPSRRARIEMLPLIDIVFLLLVFFIYAMLSMAVHRGLPVQLPASAESALEKRALPAVTLQADGTIYVDKIPVALESLAGALRERTEGYDKDDGVLLFADRRVAYQDLFHVLDKIREAGITRVSLQSEAGEHR